jgi:urease accessory protein
MLCDRVLRNIGDDFPPGGIEIRLTWQECRSRALNKTLPDSRTLRIILSPGMRLRHGDVIRDAEGEVVYITLLPTDVLVAGGLSSTDLLRVVYALGNLHLPLQIDANGVLLTPADGPARTVFRELALPTITERRRFDPLPLPSGVTFQLSGQFVITGR